MNKFFGKCSLLFFLILLMVNWGHWQPAAVLPTQNQSTPPYLIDISRAAGEWVNQNDPLIDKAWLVGDLKQQLNLAYIAQAKTASKVVIFGSSHVEYISKSILNNTSMVNHFVPAGGGLGAIEQMLARYKQKKLAPQKVVLGVDLFIIDSYFRYQDHWSVAENLTLATQIEKRHALQYLIIFQDKIRSIFISLLAYNFFNQTNTPGPVDATHIDENKIRMNTFLKSDGSVVPCESRKGCSPMPVGAVRQMMFETHRWFEGTPNPQAMQQFERIVKQMQADGIQVLFVLTPVHPVAYEGITENLILKWSYQYFSNFAHQNNIPFLGSFNPTDCNLTIDDFEDDDHLSASATEKLFLNSYCKFGQWDQFINNGL